MIFHPTVKQMLKIIFVYRKKIMENFSPDMFVTPNRAPPQYADQSPPLNDHRYYNAEPKVNLRRSGARKKLLNFYQQTPMFGQPASGQASSFRPWKEAEKSKISPYLKNKINGKFHSMSKQSPKVKQIHFFIKI